MANGFQDQNGFGGFLSNLASGFGRGIQAIGTGGLSELAIQNQNRRQAEQQAAAEQEALQQQALLQQTGQIASGQAPQFQTPEFQGLPVQQQQRQRAGALLALPTKQAQELGSELFGVATQTPERTLASRKQTEVERAAGEAEGLRRKQFGLKERQIDTELKKAVAETASGRIDKTTFDQAKVLRSELKDASTRFFLAQEGFETLQTANLADNPIGDVAMVFAFMKALDPESVVREGEFETLKNASARTDRMGEILRLHLGGHKLTRKQRQEIIDFANADFAQKKKKQIGREKRIGLLAKNLGVSIDFINPTPTAFDEEGGAPSGEGALAPQAGGQAQAAPAGIDAGLAAQILQSRGF